MAMGHTNRKLNYMSPNTEVKMFQNHVKKEEAVAREWFLQWGWMLEEYKDLQEKLDKITEKSIIVHKKAISDLRKVHPIPRSTNHEYGWIGTKPEFRLEIYGPDTIKFNLPPED